MSKINMLDIHVSNLIAAGEVVERPSSALKEIIENSIDAGASVITAEIKNGGIVYMRVTDNGEGMTAEDLGRCILRHSTSKIADEKDLRKIKTLGFRGEALAAISSVSELKIFTKQKGVQTGYMLEVSNGQNTKISEAGCADGTTVVIERLFSKVPARQKFLKRDLTESMYCKSVLEKIALSNPFISFRFIQDGRETLFTPGGGSLKNTIYAIYKDSVADRLIPLITNEQKSRSGKIKVSGYICRIEDCQSRRTDENFFVNGRYVRSKSILSAVEEAYDSVAETGKFPVCVLYVTIDESFTDVNVHPQKLEVKFSNEREIFESVYYVVKNTLQNAGYTKEMFDNDNETESEDDNTIENEHKNENENENEHENKNEVEHKNSDDDNHAPLLQFSSEHMPLSRTELNGTDSSFINTNDNVDIVDNDTNSGIYRNDVQNTNDEDKTDSYQIDIIKHNFSDTCDTSNINDVSDKNDGVQDGGIYVGARNYKFIGEAFCGYLLIEKDEKIIIIDKHAAHERILFDEITKKSGEIRKNMQLQYKSQILLEPVEIRLSPEETAHMLEFREDIEQIGIIFDLKDGEKNGTIDKIDTISVTEVPVAITDANIEEIVREMAHMLTEENYMAHEIAFEKLAMVTAKKTVACRAAMKNGIRDEPEHLMWLADRVLTPKGAKNCPHGRPVIFEITKKYLDKQFGR